MFPRLQVKLDVYLAELTKIGKSQKFTLSVDVEGGRLVVMKKAKDSQEDWTTYTHDKSEDRTQAPPSSPPPSFCHHCGLKGLCVEKPFKCVKTLTRVKTGDLVGL